MNKKMMIIGVMLMVLGFTNAYSFTQPLTTDEKRIIEWLHEWYAGAPDHDIPHKWLCQHYIPILSHECQLLREQKNAADVIISSVDERIALNHKVIEALLEFQGSTEMEIKQYMQIYC
jgi:hypothetical protein